MTSSQIDIAYKTSRKYFERTITRKDAINRMHDDGINIGYAGIFLQIFEHLKNGEGFSRTTSGKAFDYFLGSILNDFGNKQLEISLNAFKKHIEYFEDKYRINRPLYWSLFNKYTSILLTAGDTITSDDEETDFLEGKEKYRLHRLKERNSKLIEFAKHTYFKKYKNLDCQVCKFSFEETYGEIGKDYVEAHHIYPISQLTAETITKIEDIAFVCSNCHRMLHRRRPWISTIELTLLIKNECG